MGDLTNNFSRYEFACRCGCGYNTVDVELLARLQELRAYFDRPVVITSGCRCPSYNAKIGGAKNSRHMIGQAADFVVSGASTEDVQKWLEDSFPDGYGIGYYHKWTHLDVRKERARWGETERMSVYGGPVEAVDERRKKEAL